MRVTIWKNEGESGERAITRFNKKIQASRKLLGVRESRYHVHKPTKRHVRAAALMRAKYRNAREKNKFY